jgi:hypothetical protein
MSEFRPTRIEKRKRVEKGTYKAWNELLKAVSSSRSTECAQINGTILLKARNELPVEMLGKSSMNSQKD